MVHKEEILREILGQVGIGETDGHDGERTIEEIPSNRNLGEGPQWSSDGPPPEKIRIWEANKNSDYSWPIFSASNSTLNASANVEPQDADYSIVPLLSDELEAIILARFPISEYWKVCLLNKRFLALFKKGELFRIRREIRVRDLSVFMLASGERNWWVFDRQFTCRRQLPILPADTCFSSGDKETLCAGTHLIVSGKEIEDPAIWRYELATNRWNKGPSMIDPRCLFASATSGDFAFVAGGIGMGPNKGVLNSAEKYNPENTLWEPLPRMKEKRKLCSGVYMDSKFYVIGGQNENGDALTCAEVFHEEKNIWVKIHGMLKDSPVVTSESPPLVAVVNNELYLIETCSNQLKVYLKESNSWKKLGPVPVRTDFNRGWGVAFKSLGDELLVIGGSAISYAGHGMTIYTCCPNPSEGELQWKLLDSGENRSSHFILNCSVMVA
ncbi:hypothetical protein Nepgr_016875 [Nepenthes gracilis]|uniref:Uncharacterized protein n=1 Tax=Nepenthes gracilis TaxID=150966 RepID=A0AAD3SQI1_NEPGR|nr:hypothetical protein Nepgr_016875 [Nepenthes gracilis]